MRLQVTHRNFLLALCLMTTLPILSQADPEDNGEAWHKDKVCGHKLSDAIQVDTPGCDDSYCVKVTDSSQVCACLISKDTGTTMMTYKRSGATILQWETNIYPPAIASGLRVDAADLNADGKDELVVATMLSASNGMGIESWDVSVISDDKISNSVNVQDYGVMGYFSSDGKQCRLLVTRWIWGWEQKKGNGLYVAGRWFQLYDHSLEYSNDRPAIKRRYLNSLRKVRQQGFDKNKPVLWFRDPAATSIVGPYPFRD